MQHNQEKSTYLAGPMTGIPQFNYPLFLETAEYLRGEGLLIHNPVEMDDPAVRDEAMKSEDGILHEGTIGGLTWGQILAEDIKYVADECHSIILLTNWEHSRGARLEAFMAVTCGHETFIYNEERKRVIPVGKSYILHTITNTMLEE